VQNFLHANRYHSRNNEGETVQSNDLAAGGK
jgi:hypothetical protein